MFERTSPQVIDLYADLVAPLLADDTNNRGRARFWNLKSLYAFLNQYTGIGEISGLEPGDQDLLERHAYRVLTPDTATLVFRWATGHLDSWDDLRAVVPDPRTLRTRPGIIFVSPQFGRHVGPEAPPPRETETRPPSGPTASAPV